MNTAHKHVLGAQTLSHSHPGGDSPHGYFMHPEDQPGLGPEFAGRYEPDHTERDGVDLLKPTDERITRNRAIRLGRRDTEADSMKIVRDELAAVHAGDAVRYIGNDEQSQKFYGETGTVTELNGEAGLGVHFPRHAAGTNLRAHISYFRLVECVHTSRSTSDRWLPRPGSRRGTAGNDQV